MSIDPALYSCALAPAATSAKAAASRHALTVMGFVLKGIGGWRRARDRRRTPLSSSMQMHQAGGARAGPERAAARAIGAVASGIGIAMPNPGTDAMPVSDGRTGTALPAAGQTAQPAV